MVAWGMVMDGYGLNVIDFSQQQWRELVVLWVPHCARRNRSLKQIETTTSPELIQNAQIQLVGELHRFFLFNLENLSNLRTWVVTVTEVVFFLNKSCVENGILVVMTSGSLLSSCLAGGAVWGSQLGSVTVGNGNKHPKFSRVYIYLEAKWGPLAFDWSLDLVFWGLGPFKNRGHLRSR